MTHMKIDEYTALRGTLIVSFACTVRIGGHYESMWSMDDFGTLRHAVNGVFRLLRIEHLRREIRRI